MLAIIGIFLGGIFIGYLLKNKGKLLKFIEPATNITIYLLLFILGLSVGNNKAVLQQFDKIGIEAGLVSLFSIIGSIICALILYKFFFKKHEG